MSEQIKKVPSLSTVMAKHKTAELEYAGLPGFFVTLAYMTRDTMLKLRKDSTKVVFKPGQGATEEFNPDVFLKEYVKSAILGWRGLKYEYIQNLVPTDDELDIPGDLELEFSLDEALALMKGSTDFDTWVTSNVNALSNFQKNKKA